MTKVKKRTGEMEDFDRGKIESSARKAGASPETARKVAERIHAPEQVSSEEIRRQVAEQLRQEDPAVSAAYLSTKRLAAKTLSDVASGVARVHDDLARRFGIDSGARIKVWHDGRERELRLERSTRVHPQEVQMAESDLRRLGASDGSKVSVVFPR